MELSASEIVARRLQREEYNKGFDENSDDDNVSDGEEYRPKKPNSRRRVAKENIAPKQMTEKTSSSSSLKTNLSEIGLRDLIEKSFIQPGKDVLHLEYMNETSSANLLENGTIEFTHIQNDVTVSKQFHSVSSFSLFIKRRKNPSRRADDGWTCVKYLNRPLGEYKRKYQNFLTTNPQQTNVTHLSSADVNIESKELSEISTNSVVPASKSLHQSNSSVSADMLSDNVPLEKMNASNDNLPENAVDSSNNCECIVDSQLPEKVDIACKDIEKEKVKEEEEEAVVAADNCLIKSSTDGELLTKEISSKESRNVHIRAPKGDQKAKANKRKNAKSRSSSFYGAEEGFENDSSDDANEKDDDYRSTNYFSRQKSPFTVPRDVPQRTRKPRSSLLREMNDDLSLVQCEEFFKEEQAPFTVTLSPEAVSLMDFHAHCASSEIIGLLGGKWDKIEKNLVVVASYPCRSLETLQSHVNVEMDPLSEMEIREEIQKDNLSVVGWYHSHPTFRPDPSLRDIDNQWNYQRLFQEEMPFLGVIVCPFDVSLPGNQSVFKLFWVESDDERKDTAGRPRSFPYTIRENHGENNEPTETAASEKSMQSLKTKMNALYRYYQTYPFRISFEVPWRGNTTYKEKLVDSIGSYFETDELRKGEILKSMTELL